MYVNGSSQLKQLCQGKFGHRDGLLLVQYQLVVPKVYNGGKYNESKRTLCWMSKG